MRKPLSLVLTVLPLSFILVGCVAPGPEAKFGRGINNITEFARGGEIQRSMEQMAIYGDHNAGYTTGLMNGFNRSLQRTFVGAYEIVTVPFPPYSPIICPADPVYPEAYKPGIIDDVMFSTDVNMGFSGGDIMPPVVSGS